MGSTETDSTDDLHKMWLDDDLGIYAVGAGILEYGGELFTIVQNELKDAIKTGPKTHGRVSGALNRAFHILKSQHFQWDIFPALSIYGVGNLVPQDKVLEEWQRYSISLHMLFAMLDHEGQAYLYLVGQFGDAHGMVPKTVHLCEFPGHATIGTGGDNAQFWLNYRRQALGMNVKRSAYHSYEAKRMAEKTPTVNDTVEIAVVMPGRKAYHLTEEHPQLDGCPVSLAELETMFEKHGPPETESIKLLEDKKPRLAPRP